MEIDEELYEEEDDYLVRRNILLRNYQINLLEKAKRGNSIIYLPPGAGKTLIGIHTLCSKSNEIRRPYSEGGKRAFFAATTKIMVTQMGEVLRTHTKFKVACFTGDMNVDTWSRKKWLTLFEINHVLVLTGDILKHLLQLNFINITNICFILFDECHHAVADHPYSLILQFIKEVDPSEAPLLLGLTAVLINGSPKVHQVSQLIRSLENAFRGKVITDGQVHEVMRFAASPEEKIILYEELPIFYLPEIVLTLYNNTIDVLESLILKESSSTAIPEGGREFKDRNKAKRMKRAIVQSRGHFEELGLFGGSLSVLFYIIFFEKIRLLSEDPKEIQLLIYATTELNKIRHVLLKIMGEEETSSLIISNSTPKVQCLIKTIVEIKEFFSMKNFSTLIFVYQRSSAVLLAFLLKRLSITEEKYSFIKADFVVGFSKEREASLPENKNEEIVKQFGSGSLNTLVTTNLLEEGIDISACNAVISFDFPNSYSSYFQSKGRARDKNSLHYLLLKESEKSEKICALNIFKNTEKELSKGFFTEADNLEEDNLIGDVEKLQINGKEAIIDGIIAIRAVERYCGKLPQDKFSLLSPISWYVDEGSYKKAFVQLPVNCPLLEVIEGTPQRNSKFAKRSAFLITLKRLYEIGELDDDFNLKSFEAKEVNFKDLFPYYKKETIPKHLPQPGTKRRKQIYKHKYAESLSYCLPQPGCKAYLHVLDLTVVFDKPLLERKVAIYDILRIPVTFAILSSKRLCKIFQFPLFVDMGQINCDLLVNYDEIILTESELDDIKSCHFSLFKKVAKIIHNSQVFDSTNKGHSFLVVPVEKNEEGRFVLNWDIIRCDYCKNSNSILVKYNPSNGAIKRTAGNFSEITNCNDEMSNCLVPFDTLSGRFLWKISPDTNQEPEFTVTEANYQYFVIIPNYRNEYPPQCYIVSKFCRDMSPLSPFPKIGVQDFFTYYKEKYLIEVTNKKQPLLRVSPLFNCTNFNRSRNRKLHRSRDKFKEYEEHFLPELCDVIPFDRRYWIKALLLPTILNRIYHVYCVEEFRRKIVLETGLGSCELPEGISWEPLKVGNTVEDETNSKSKSLDLNISLPLSKLKDKTLPLQEPFLDPERHMYDIGLCDLEYCVSYLKKHNLEDESLDQEEQVLSDNDEILKLASLRNISVPILQILEKKGNPFGPDLAVLVQVCTAKSANDIVDYERLEILGDSFLKFAATFFLFKNYNDNEGILTSVKGKIVGNRNLLYCGLEKGIQDIINVVDFVPVFNWNPPLLSIPERLVDSIINNNVDPAVLYRLVIPLDEQISGVLSENTLQKNEEIIQNFDKCCEVPTNSFLPYKAVEDKTISDCVEAFIGAYLLSLGLSGAFEFLMWLGILPKSKGSYSELIGKPYEIHFLSPEGDSKIMSLLSEVFYSDLEDVLNYRFKSKALLLEALTHPSFSKNRVTNCYQRLELLGDAVLDFLITTYIYENCGNLTPGQVTDIRSSLVNNITFACLVVRFELHKYMLSFSSTLRNAIKNFVMFQINRNHVVDDNVFILLQESDCLIAETAQVPKALGDLFESLAGAIFLDSGNSLKTVWEVYYKLMKREIDKFTETVPKTSVRLLQEICGDQPYYESVTLKDVVKVSCSIYFENREIKAHGFGANKKEAKHSAAKLVLNKILAMKR